MGGGGGGSNEVRETADQVEQMKINAELWNFYQTQYKPMIDKYIAKTTDPATQELATRDITGKVAGDIMKNVSSAGAVSPNPVVNTKKLMSIADIATKGKLKGEAASKGKQIAETQNLINIGRGEATEATEGMSDIAARSLNTAITDMSLSQQRDAAIEDAMGSLAGLGVATYFRPQKKKLTVKNPYDYPLGDLPM